MGLLEEIARYLGSQGIGVYSDDPEQATIFINHMPSSPDKILAVYQRGGPEPFYWDPFDVPEVQVLVRGAVGEEWEVVERANQVYAALHGLMNLNFGTINIIGITAINMPTSLGTDDLRRPEYTVSFLVHHVRR